jgi:hypothetical protein
MNHWHMKFGMEIHHKYPHDSVTKHCFEAKNYKPGNDANFVGISILNLNLNLFSVHLIHMGYDPLDMKLVNTEIRLQILYMK